MCCNTGSIFSKSGSSRTYVGCFFAYAGCFAALVGRISGSYISWSSGGSLRFIEGTCWDRCCWIYSVSRKEKFAVCGAEVCFGRNNNKGQCYLFL